MPLLERIGVQSRIMDYVRVLSGVRVNVPIAGTRGAPRLDFSKVDIGSLVQKAIQLLLQEQLSETIGDILERPEADNPDQEEKDKPETRPADKIEDQLRDTLFDLLRETLDEKGEKDKQKGTK